MQFATHAQTLVNGTVQAHLADGDSLAFCLIVDLGGCNAEDVWNGQSGPDTGCFESRNACIADGA